MLYWRIQQFFILAKLSNMLMGGFGFLATNIKSLNSTTSRCALSKLNLRIVQIVLEAWAKLITEPDCLKWTAKTTHQQALRLSYRKSYYADLMDSFISELKEKKRKHIANNIQTCSFTEVRLNAIRQIIGKLLASSQLRIIP